MPSCRRTHDNSRLSCRLQPLGSGSTPFDRSGRVSRPGSNRRRDCTCRGTRASHSGSDRRRNANRGQNRAGTASSSTSSVWPARPPAGRRPGLRVRQLRTGEKRHNVNHARSSHGPCRQDAARPSLSPIWLWPPAPRGNRVIPGHEIPRSRDDTRDGCRLSRCPSSGQAPAQHRDQQHRLQRAGAECSG